MNLIKNVDGDWPQAKNHVRGDLDTIQRAVNALQAQLTALTKVVNTPDPVPAAVITPANTVTTFDQDFLRSVATIPLGGLKGNGTQTQPLGVDVDGTTITFNSAGQLEGSAGGVVVDAAGALDGDGTGGSPLAVRVDGATITINGSNELEVAGGSNPVLYSLVTITGAALINSFTTPIPILPAPGAGLFIIPISATIVIHKPGATFEIGPIPTYSFLYSGGIKAWSDIAPGTGAAWTDWFDMLNINNYIDFAAPQDNQSINLSGNFNGGAWFPNATGVVANLGVLYTIQSL